MSTRTVTRFHYTTFFRCKGYLVGIGASRSPFGRRLCGAIWFWPLPLRDVLVAALPAFCRAWTGSGRVLRAALPVVDGAGRSGDPRSEEHTSELQSLMRISYAVFCLKKKNTTKRKTQ